MRARDIPFLRFPQYIYLFLIENVPSLWPLARNSRISLVQWLIVNLDDKRHSKQRTMPMQNSAYGNQKNNEFRFTTDFYPYFRWNCGPIWGLPLHVAYIIRIFFGHICLNSCWEQSYLDEEKYRRFFFFHGKIVVLELESICINSDCDDSTEIVFFYVNVSQ